MDAQKLAKVLALAASDNDSEALHALRTAKRLLEGEGADFVELARRLAEGPAKPGHEVDALEDAVFDLRNEIRHLRAENERLRQGRAATPAEAPSLQDATRDAAAAIRLRAELAALAEELEDSRTENLGLKAREAGLHEQFKEALAEAGQLAAKLAEMDTRRMRLEVENRRLTHANHALTRELEEARCQSGTIEAQLLSHEVRQELAGKKPKRGRKKGGDSQYALL